MNRIRMLPVFVGIAAVCVLLASCAKEQTNVVAVIANRSGHDVTSISITPSTSDMWDTEYLEEVFADGDSFAADLGTYFADEVPQFNILVRGEDGERLYDSAVEAIGFDIGTDDYIVFLPPEETAGIVICNEDEFNALYDVRTAPSDGEDDTEEAAEEDTIDELAAYIGCFKPEKPDKTPERAVYAAGVGAAFQQHDARAKKQAYAKVSFRAVARQNIFHNIRHLILLFCIHVARFCRLLEGVGRLDGLCRL